MPSEIYTTNQSVELEMINSMPLLRCCQASGSGCQQNLDHASEHRGVCLEVENDCHQSVPLAVLTQVTLGFSQAVIIQYESNLYQGRNSTCTVDGEQQAWSHARLSPSSWLPVILNALHGRESVAALPVR